MRGIQDSAARLVDALAQNQITFEDHSGQRYQEGKRLDVVHVEGDPEAGQALWVSETVKPTVFLNGRLLAAGHVILTTAQPEDVAKK